VGPGAEVGSEFDIGSRWQNALSSWFARAEGQSGLMGSWRKSGTTKNKGRQKQKYNFKAAPFVEFMRPIEETRREFNILRLWTRLLESWLRR